MSEFIPHPKVIRLPLSDEKAKLLYGYSRRNNIQIERLIEWALDNELEKKIPFDFGIEMPTEEYVEYAYVEEAGKILHYLRQYPKGLSLEYLMLSRKHIGIDDKKTFMLAWRECVDKDFVKSVVKLRKSDKTPYKIWLFKP